MSSSQFGVITLSPLKKDYIAEVTIDDVSSSSSSSYQTVVILDRSGSMGKQVGRMINRILPSTFQKLSYKKLNMIYLITFETVSELHTETVQKFPSLSISSGNYTYMQPAVKICQEIFEMLDSSKPVRVLTISDGEVQDQVETAQAADEFSKFLENKGFFINSKAVRLFTSSSQPDTTALCSLLQINSATPESLVDISANETDDSIAEKIADLFRGDDFGKSQLLTTSSKVLCFEPWITTDEQLSKILLTPGQNVFWVSTIPSDGFKINGAHAKSIVKSSITMAQLEVLLGAKAAMIIEKMRILKVVGSSKTEKVLRRSYQYFTETQKVLAARSPSSNNSGMSITNAINGIVNDNSVAKMNSAEKALYLAKKN